MFKIDSATWAIAVAFIVVGLLTQYQPVWGGWNWVIAGVVALLVAWVGMAGKKK
jgi:hypothetical protein